MNGRLRWFVAGIEEFFWQRLEPRATLHGNKAQKPCNLNLLCSLLFYSPMMIMVKLCLWVHLQGLNTIKAGRVTCRGISFRNKI